MSALSLQYPKKPIEVADDLESFIYVGLQCALRFHPHEMSPRELIEDDCKLSLEVLQKINGQNTALASTILPFFYDSYKDASSRWSIGGKQKRFWIDIGSPQIKLTTINGETSALAVLLNRLYDLLNKHYKAIDHDALKPYAVDRITDVRKEAPRKKTVYIGSEDLELDDDVRARVLGNALTLSPEAPTVVVKAPSTTPATRALDTHSDILTILIDIMGRGIEVTEDKTLDQFEGLQKPVLKALKRASGFSHNSGSDSKRRRTESQSQSPALNTVDEQTRAGHTPAVSDVTSGSNDVGSVPDDEDGLGGSTVN